MRKTLPLEPPHKSLEATVWERSEEAGNPHGLTSVLYSIKDVKSEKRVNPPRSLNVVDYNVGGCSINMDKNGESGVSIILSGVTFAG